jgi:hypothetical protein
MFPNTFMFQELARRYFDENIDREEDGETVETPYIYTIAKGISSLPYEKQTSRADGE